MYLFNASVQWTPQQVRGDTEGAIPLHRRRVTTEVEAAREIIKTQTPTPHAILRLHPN